MNERFLIPILAVFGLLVIFGLLAAFLSGRASSDHPYEAYDSLLSPAERSFFGVLQEALGPDFSLFAKVRLADILRVQRGLSAQRRSAAFNRISSKHADFVLCDPKTLRVLGVIELDDKSHREETRQRRDKFLDAALATARIPVLHVPAQRSYSITELRTQLRSTFPTNAATANIRHA